MKNNQVKQGIFLILILLLNIVAVQAQNKIKISGSVWDTAGNPLVGVSVTVKGETVGTITDANGIFTLQVPHRSIIRFSYVGFVQQELVANTLNGKKIILEEDAKSLSEVVVVGYGTQAKINLTGAIKSLDSKELQSKPITNLSSALQGLSSGVDVVQSSGQPGEDAATIRIRGINSLENNNDPLVIIDGMEGNINNVNPQDISQISILKDASACAIYGNRASDGVIIITTKTGSEGKVEIGYSNNIAWQTAIQLPEVVEALPWTDLYIESREYAGLVSTLIDPEGIANELNSGRRQSTNWYKKFYKTAPMQNHYVTMRGGNRFFKGALSFNYLDQDGILFNTSLKKYSVRGNMSSSLFNNRFRITANFSGTRRIKDANSRGEGQMINDINLSSTAEPFFSQGLYSYNARDMAIKEAGGLTQTKSNELDGKIDFSLDILKNKSHLLRAQVIFGGNYQNSNLVDYVPDFKVLASLDGNSSAFTGGITKKNTEATTLLNEDLLIYEYKGTDIKINGLLGFSQREWNYSFLSADRKDSFATFPLLIMADPSTQQNADGADKKNDRSVFARFNFSYKDKYLLELSGRYDGSSRFASGSQWGLFPSASLGWRISEEQFYKKSKLSNIVGNLKLRGSYGILGNQNINTYYAGSNILSATSVYDFDGKPVSGTSLTTIANTGTTWEKTSQVNVGIDLGVFNDLNISVDYFYKHTYDLLWKVPLPLSLGMGIGKEGYQNIGKMKNRGVDIDVAYNKRFLGNRLGFQAKANVSVLKNEITDLGDQTRIFHDNEVQVIASQVGMPYGSFYGYDCTGVYQLSDFNWTDQAGQNANDPNIPIKDRKYTLKSGHPTQTPAPRPGDLIFRDISGPDGVPDGQVDATYDRTVIGSQFPDFTYSLNLYFDFKGFDFSVMFYGVQGRSLYEQGLLTVPFYNGNGGVTKEVADNRWTYENPSTTNPRLYIEKEFQQTRSSYYVRDASYLRIKNIELGYTLPKLVLEKLKVLQNARVFVNAQNAFTFTKHKDFDPEHSAFSINNGSYPVTRVISCGVKLDF